MVGLAGVGDKKLSVLLVKVGLFLLLVGALCKERVRVHVLNTSCNPTLVHNPDDQEGRCLPVGPGQLDYFT